MTYHGDQIFVIAAKAFYNFAKTWINHKYWAPFDSVVDIALQQNSEARRFSKPIIC